MFWSDLRQSFGITSCCSLDTQSAYSDVYLENSGEVLPKFCPDRIGAWKLTHIRIREGSGQLCSATLGKIFLARVFPCLSSVVTRDPREPISLGRATLVPPLLASDCRTSSKHRATPKPCASRCTVPAPHAEPGRRISTWEAVRHQAAWEAATRYKYGLTGCVGSLSFPPGTNALISTRSKNIWFE
jgi:hypothetical protein